jgi:hypothetical protein
LVPFSFSFLHHRFTDLTTPSAQALAAMNNFG